MRWTTTMYTIFESILVETVRLVTEKGLSTEEEAIAEEEMVTTEERMGIIEERVVVEEKVVITKEAIGLVIEERVAMAVTGKQVDFTEGRALP